MAGRAAPRAGSRLAESIRGGRRTVGAERQSSDPDDDMTSTRNFSNRTEERAELDRLRAEVAEWRKRFAEGEARGASFVNSAGEVAPLYTALDVSPDSAEDLGVPGDYPYTRGIHPTGYRGKLWTMRQFAGFGSASDTNARFKFLLEHGQTGLSTAFDFPTLMGYDSDHPRSLGEVGKTGVAISSLADMEVLFDGIPLDKVRSEEHTSELQSQSNLVCRLLLEKKKKKKKKKKK